MENADDLRKPRISSDWKFSEEVLNLQYSYGYDCLKKNNLQCLETGTLAFVAGSFVEIINIEKGKVKFIHSTSSGGIGSVAVHPKRRFLAVAEKGRFPNIVIYDYPSLMICHVLKGGTEKSFSHMAFSCDGKLLASVGGDPDYTMTIWNWQTEATILRSKAYSQEVFKVSFSPLQHDLLTSAGTGHIKFWKMASTFTGLKLQGKVGKFQKREISDIEGYAELPDGKVLSGCEWGNLLVWEGGLIKVELSRKNDRSCHDGAIQQVIYNGDRILTMGLDGYVRAWDFDNIDGADTTNESDSVEIEPINELYIGEGVKLKSAVRAFSFDRDEEVSNTWYAQLQFILNTIYFYCEWSRKDAVQELQNYVTAARTLTDAAGGIWKLDLSFSEPLVPPERLFTCHSGPVTALCTSPSICHRAIASIGVDGTVRIYDYDKDQMICMSRYNQPGTALLWMPQEVIE